MMSFLTTHRFSLMARNLIEIEKAAAVAACHKGELASRECPVACLPADHSL